jgi:hypothetical protein
MLYALPAELALRSHKRLPKCAHESTSPALGRAFESTPINSVESNETTEGGIFGQHRYAHQCAKIGFPRRLHAFQAPAGDRARFAVKHLTGPTSALPDNQPITKPLRAANANEDHHP